MHTKNLLFFLASLVFATACNTVEKNETEPQESIVLTTEDTLRFTDINGNEFVRTYNVQTNTRNEISGVKTQDVFLRTPIAHTDTIYDPDAPEVVLALDSKRLDFISAHVIMPLREENLKQVFNTHQFTKQGLEVNDIFIGEIYYAEERIFHRRYSQRKNIDLALIAKADIVTLQFLITNGKQDFSYTYAFLKEEE